VRYLLLEPISHADLDTGAHAEGRIGAVSTNGLKGIRPILHNLTGKAEVEQGFAPEEEMVCEIKIKPGAGKEAQLAPIPGIIFRSTILSLSESTML
jgi:hypothetical protein